MAVQYVVMAILALPVPTNLDHSAAIKVPSTKVIETAYIFPTSLQCQETALRLNKQTKLPGSSERLMGTFCDVRVTK